MTLSQENQPIMDRPPTLSSWSILAGLSGAFLAVTFLPRLSFGRAASTLAGGTVTSIFVAPWLALDVLHLKSPHALAAISFGVGVVGLTLISGIFEVVNRRKRHIAGVVIDKIAGRGDDSKPE